MDIELKSTNFLINRNTISAHMWNLRILSRYVTQLIPATLKFLIRKPHQLFILNQFE